MNKIYYCLFIFVAGYACTREKIWNQVPVNEIWNDSLFKEREVAVSYIQNEEIQTRIIPFKQIGIIKTVSDSSMYKMVLSLPMLTSEAFTISFLNPDTETEMEYDIVFANPVVKNADVALECKCISQTKVNQTTKWVGSVERAFRK